MPSIHEALSEALAAEKERVAVEQPAVETPVVEASGEVEAVTPTPDKPLGRTAGRPRDEHGKLLPGKPTKDAAAQVPAAAGTVPSTVPSPAAAATPALAPLQRPSSWKKEMWPVWEKMAAGQPLTPQEARSVAEYNVSREGDFAKGVSTYKTEYDRLKPLGDAISEVLPALQQHGLEPAAHVRSLLNAHNTLATAAPQARLAMFAQLAQQYQVPLEQMFVRGQDGQVYFNQQLLQQAQAQPAQQPRTQAQQPDVRTAVQQAIMEERIASDLQAFESNTTQYPHYQQVKETMAGLLQSGLADDLPSAYDAAIRHPRHADLYEAAQEQSRQADAQRIAEEKRAVAQRARANASSPRTSTPTGAQGADTGAKGRREIIAEQVAALSGRV